MAFMRFPGGKKRALTLSYDDGVIQDKRLVAILDKYGLKGTFNINTGLFADPNEVFPPETVHRRLTRQECIDLYDTSRHEVAVHGVHHPFLTEMSQPCVTAEVLEDRKTLEEMFPVTVRGMAYPFGAYNDEVLAALKTCGIAYARTVESTHGFDLPSQWLTLHPTCHHNDEKLMELADAFLNCELIIHPLMFYLWGHSYEFDNDNNWDVIETFARKMGGREDVWYATNMEIFNYVTAYDRLIFSVDGLRVENPTAIDLYMEHNGIVCVPAGQTVELK